MKKDLSIQSFYYKNTTFRYRLTEEALSRFKHLSGKNIITEIGKGGEHVAAVLYECVCWCGYDVSKEEFCLDWKLGRVFFRIGSKGEKSVASIIKAIRHAVKKYRLE